MVRSVKINRRYLYLLYALITGKIGLAEIERSEIISRVLSPSISLLNVPYKVESQLNHKQVLVCWVGYIRFKECFFYSLFFQVIEVRL